ncbi:endonuclease domain-containing protein [Demequina activiva]|uniref:DUF559 domain-containing protein n=1 Tax=Demequina activiva TaxID=1582364 RepID=A0A919Q0I9_9MICO|nr:DUF559 domain-containing protein [Demequina activiva]GIG54075.1 hypothetical protein Dac01nite_08270 [Demequina activiva]
MSLADLVSFLESTPASFSLAELMRGASRGGVRAAITRGEITRVLPDRYAASLHAESWAVRSHAAAMWGPDGCALTGAGALFDAGLLPLPPAVVDLRVPRWRHRPSAPWLRITSTTYVPPVVLTRPDGATLVDSALALVHAYGRAPERERAELVYRLTRSNLVDPEAVRLHLDSLPRARGRASLLRRCALAQDGVESYLEERGAEEILVGRGFESIVRQHRLRVRGELFRLDAYDAQTRTAVEFDGSEFHAEPAQRVRDIRRDATLATIGILTLRFGYGDVEQRPDWCRDMVRDTLEARRLST